MTTTVRRVERNCATAVTRALDAATDGVVVALAVWTVLYHAALVLRTPTDALLAIWVAILAGIAVVAIRLRRPVSAGWAGGRLLPVPLALAGAAVAGVLVVQRSPAQWWTGWGVSAAVVVVALVAAVLLRRPARAGDATNPETADAQDTAEDGDAGPAGRTAGDTAHEERPAPRPWLVVLAMAALATLALYTYHVDGDDSFYLNKSSWVAAHGHLTTRDTLYTDERLGHLAGAGVPVQSIESLQGAIAHLFGLSAPTVVYLVFPPIMVAAAVWALWRLVRYLAPRRASLAFLVAGAYFSVSHLGSFTFTRMWMGKAVFFSLVIPLLYLYLSRWADRRRTRDALLLVAVGAASVGLMSAATVVIAVAVAAALIAMFAGSGLRTAAGALLPAAYPVGAGLLVATAVSLPGVPGRAFDTGHIAMAATLGEAAVGGIAWAALIAAASLARTSGGRLAALGGAAATVAVALPAVPHAIDAATGSGIVLYRLFWVAPVPAMVGLLATLPLPRLPRWAGWVQAVPAAALVAVLLAPGAFYWGQGLLRTPAWKLDPVALAQARAIARLHPGPGPVLAPRPTMMTIGIITVDFHAVSPNASYIYNHVIPESTADADARVVLHHLMWDIPPRADVAKAPAALHRLDVSLVCLAPEQILALKAVRRAGFVVDRGEAAGLSCLGRSPGGWPPVALGGGG